MGKKMGFSFSWKRALGVSSVKQKVARATGIPTTKAGRERKLGNLLMKLFKFQGYNKIYIGLRGDKIEYL